MSDPFEISSRYVDDVVALTPGFATSLGVVGFDHLWSDRSPEGRCEQNVKNLAVISDLAPHRDHSDRHQRLAARVITEFASSLVESFEAEDHLRDLAHTASGFQNFREIFEIMDHRDVDVAEAAAIRLESIGDAIGLYRESLDVGLARGLAVSRRQVESVIDQAEALIGPSSAWHLLEEGSPIPDRIITAIKTAKSEMAKFLEYLRTDYAPNARESDGVGRDAYIRASRSFLGMRIDPDEVYAWGWEEIRRLTDEMRRVAMLVDPALELGDVIHRLETDPTLSARGPQALLDFVSARQERAIRDLDGVHFDLPSEIRSVAVKLAPPGGALGAYYRDPSEDFKRPGAIYYSVGDQSVFPLYQEVATAYHEGFPGHHLQIGTSLANRQSLSRAQRALIWYSGYGEGWALYTERLMEELGYFERPEWTLGMLASQLFRASRVVVDIGLHLEMVIPKDAPVFGGEPWSFERAVAFMSDVGLQPADYAVSDVMRYLGWPGQAISYKVGEREILKLRESERARLKDDFELKDFHSRVLSGGEMGLDLLKEVVSGSFLL